MKFSNLYDHDFVKLLPFHVDTLERTLERDLARDYADRLSGAPRSESFYRYRPTVAVGYENANAVRSLIVED